MTDQNPTAIGAEWDSPGPPRTEPADHSLETPRKGLDLAGLSDEAIVKLLRPPLWKRVLRSDWLIRLVALAVFLGVWQSISSRVNRVLFASPKATWYGLRSLWLDGSLGSAWRESLLVLFVGLGISAVLGIGLGLLLGRQKTLNQLVQPPLTAIFMTPKIALLPLISLWMGFQYKPKIVVVVLFSFFQIYYTFLAGVRTIDADYVQVARAYGITGWRQTVQIIVPASLPYLITSLRLGLLHGMVGVVLGGFFLETNGIGGIIGDYASTFQIAKVLAILITVSIVGVVINVGLQLAERWLVPWKSEDFA